MVWLYSYGRTPSGCARAVGPACALELNATAGPPAVPSGSWVEVIGSAPVVLSLCATVHLLCILEYQTC
jgi:hypothetical protein